MSTTTEMELTPRGENYEQDSSHEEAGNATPAHEFSLPPVDGGKDAWLMLASAFFIEGFVWGFPYAFGILQDYYVTHEPFAANSSHSAIIGTVALGIMYLGSPIGLSLLQRFAKYRRACSIAGVLISSGAIAISSFCTRVWQLILTQGILWALGASLLYYPILIYIDEWFVRRKSLAYSIMWAGTAVSGIITPYIYTWLLTHYTYPTAMRAWSVVALLGPALFVHHARPRLPITTTSSTTPRPHPFHFLRSRRFLLYQTGNIAHGLGFFLPSIYLPSYARSLGQSPQAASTHLALFNLGSFVGSIATGAACDRWDVTPVLGALSGVAAMATFLLWGLSGRVAVGLVYAFAVMFGVSAGGFASTWPAVVRDVGRGGGEVLETGPAFGMLAAGRGIGSIASGPLGEVLLKAWVGGADEAGCAYASRYGPVVIFTGVAMVFGGTGFGAKRLGLM